MYYFFLIFCLCKFTFAAVLPQEQDARILSYEYNNFGSGNYEFSYETSNGIKRNETGQLVNAGQENEHMAVRGFYSYIDPNGKPRFFYYAADENGYRINFEESLDERLGEGFEGLAQASPVAPHIASLLGR